MSVLDRLFGITDDATAGGKDFETLGGVGAVSIPNATIFYPVTGGTFDAGTERIDRNNEVRGRRANVPPRPFRAAPSMVVPMSAYQTALEKIVYKCLGVVNTSGGTSPTPYTHTVSSLQYPTVTLPALHAQMVRDTLNVKMGGSTINRITLDFPLDGEGTLEFEAFGKYYLDDPAASPTPTYTGFDAEAETLMLRDAKVYIDGSSTQVADIQGFNLTFNNNLERKWYAGRNIDKKTLGTPSQTRKVWFPTENKAQAAPDITFSITFGSTDDAQELALWYTQIQKFEFDVAGNPIGGGYTGDNMMKIILYNAAYTGGGAGALSARDDITSSYDGGVFYSEADSKDLEIQFVTSTATLS